jgi:hypothetical protein
VTVAGGGIAPEDWAKRPLVLTIVDGDRAAEVEAPLVLGGTVVLAGVWLATSRR